jgi:hypothetical protein
LPEDFLFVRGIDTLKKATYARNVPPRQPCILPVQNVPSCAEGSAEKIGDVLFVKGVDHIAKKHG